MTFREFLLEEAMTNIKKGKKIAAIAKDKAKKNNPGETELRGGWSVDPHQGSFNNPRITR